MMYELIKWIFISLIVFATISLLTVLALCILHVVGIFELPDLENASIACLFLFLLELSEMIDLACHLHSGRSFRR